MVQGGGGSGMTVVPVHQALPVGPKTREGGAQTPEATRRRGRHRDGLTSVRKGEATGWAVAVTGLQWAGKAGWGRGVTTLTVGPVGVVPGEVLRGAGCRATA